MTPASCRNDGESSLGGVNERDVWQALKRGLRRCCSCDGGAESCPAGIQPLQSEIKPTHIGENAEPSGDYSPIIFQGNSQTLPSVLNHRDRSLVD